MDKNSEKSISSPSAKYIVQKIVGEGGMKSILRAYDSETGRDVAMAVMNDHYGIAGRTFVEEALLTARLEHPNIVPVHEIGTGLSGEPYFTMKLLSGVDLSRILDRLHAGDRHYLERFPLRSLLEIFLKVCDAVAFAHSKGIIHLDLKPDNIQVGEFGEVLVLDWGLAKQITQPEDEASRPGASTLNDFFPDSKSKGASTATVDGVVKGTPAYMSPEQAMGKKGKKDFRTDIYALGAILYSLLTFKPPVTGANAKELISNVLHSRIIPARSCMPKGRPVPPSLEFVSYKAMDRNPDLRYQTVEELKSEIEAYLAGFATRAEDAGLFTQLWLLLLRKRSEALLLAAAVSVTCLLTAFLLIHLYNERTRAERALASLKASEAANAGLVERMSQESRREWRLLFEEGFRDKYVLERWTVNQPQAFSAGPDGLRLASPTAVPFRLLFRERLSQDSIKLLFEVSFNALAPDGHIDLLLQGGAQGDGYSFRLGGAKSPKASISRSQRQQPLAESSAPLPEGRRCLILTEVQRSQDGARLRLEVDGREIISVLDPAPPPLNQSSSSVGLVASSASLALYDMKLYALDAPLKAELLDIANRHLNKGNFSTAADLFSELLESSPDSLKRDAATEGLHIAKLMNECKSRLPEWRMVLERAWPQAKTSLSIDTDGFRVEVESQSPIKLTPLKGLPISSLKLRCHNLSDLSALKDMKLLSLDISGCSVTGLDALSSMPLKKLVCDGNPLGSLLPLKGIPTLKSLSLKSCDLNSIEALHGQTLASLDISSNHIVSLEALAGMPLETLDCSGNPIRSLRILDLESLKTLRASSCSLSILPPLGSSKLESLSCASNSISSLEPLRGSPLKRLELQANMIGDISPLSTCPSLEALSIDWNQVSSLSPLSGLRFLKSLSCDGNAISSLEPLKGMDGLLTLSAQSNSLQDISPLSGLFSLAELDISGNMVHSLEPLDSLSLDCLLCGGCHLESYGKSLAFPPRRRFVFDRPELGYDEITKLIGLLGSGPYARDLDKSLNTLASFKSGDIKALKETAFELDGRLYSLIPTMRTCEEAKRDASALGGSLPDSSAPERLELLAKRFSSPFWTSAGACVASSGSLIEAGSSRRLLPLLIEWTAK